jgi:hypothetical protein
MTDIVNIGLLKDSKSEWKMKVLELYEKKRAPPNGT